MHARRQRTLLFLLGFFLIWVGPSVVAARPARTDPRDGPSVRTLAQGGRTWVPGHWAIQRVREMRPGHWERIYVPPVTRTRIDARGRRTRVVVTPGHYKRKWVAGRTVTVERKVWIKGHWRH